MKFYWSYKSFPEFANVPPEVRDRVWKRCLKSANRQPITWLLRGSVLMFIVAPSLCGWGHLAHGIQSGSSRLLLFLGVLSLIAIVDRLAELWVARKQIAAVFRGHCRGCGYDLTGNVSGTCPECGTASA